MKERKPNKFLIRNLKGRNCMANLSVEGRQF
jgi:hypothetical protein